MRGWLALLLTTAAVAQQPPLAPFTPDAATVLLYHCDEGAGAQLGDSGPQHLPAELRGALWTDGRFGGGLRFDGRQASVWRPTAPALTGLRQLTVECWFKQDNPAGRQFLVGQDVGFHFDVSDGAATSLSIYNEGGGKPNAEGKPHQHLGTGGFSLRPRVWHHAATTYDGRQISFFVDGLLRQRLPAARDFLLGAPSRGLWLGCYIGSDYWFSGALDEVRVSNVVRYDPQSQLAIGQRIFELPAPPRPGRAVRPLQRRGLAQVTVQLTRRHGGAVAGWIHLQPPSGPARVVGQYDLTAQAPGTTSRLTCDVSDEVGPEGVYLLALEPTRLDGYLTLTSAGLRRGERELAAWRGELSSRRTDRPTLLLPLRVGPAARLAAPARQVVLRPATALRSGELDLLPAADGVPELLSGDGAAEWWIDTPSAADYRVYLQYVSPALRPCDLLLDGQDLHAFHMLARETTPSAEPLDALWRYQGTVRLAAGAHWLRLQDVLPDVAGLRLDPVASRPATTLPWARYAVPDGTFLATATGWVASPLHGAPSGAALPARDGVTWRATFGNTAAAELAAGDALRLRLAGQWDLEPFGALEFRWRGSGSGHVAAWRLIDAKGDEKLLWLGRDEVAGDREIQVGLSFEGNDVFDPGHVVAVCLDLDEGNVRTGSVNRWSGELRDLRLVRRDQVVWPAGYAARQAAARASLARLQEPAAVLRARPGRPLNRPVVPEEHPLFATTEPRPVTRATLGAGFQMTGARGIHPDTLDDFHRHYDFGSVCWPHLSICPQRARYRDEAAWQAALSSFEQQLREVQRRGLLLFDVWGYVPDNPDFPWVVAPEHKAILQRVCGDRFLGFDNGEQDGRYIGAYADRGPAQTRREGWQDFLAWDRRIAGDHQDFMNATGSLNFSHYYGERGARLLGLETAQGLPSDTLLFAFLRGAGRQYGRLTYQATSVWNRYGYNLYTGHHTEGANGYGYGPHKGCSLSLHRRLLLSGFLGGHSIGGTETGQFTADRLPSGAPELSPLGRQHLEILKWTREHPARGVPETPLAVVLDFHHGWNMPRHLYRSDRYKIWGKFAYEPGDYGLDNLFRLIWPGYQDASYLRNERGFLTPTPFGDSFDVVTNRCHPAILRQYRALLLAGEVELTPEFVAALRAFVAGGGDLLLDAQHAAALPPELAGVQVGEVATGCASKLLAGNGRVFDEAPYRYRRLALRGAQPLLLSDAGEALLTVHAAGPGRVVVSAVDHWQSDKLTWQRPELVNIESPYRLLQGLTAALGGYFDSLAPVAATPAGLGLQTCYFDRGDRLLVGLFNNDLFAAWQGTLTVRRGKLSGATETWRKLPLQRRGNALTLRLPPGEVALLELRGAGL
ncbi:MAG: LamG domain-containing protein [Fimbriimonadaceae bacterium]|nr:LamG domain-containing protein [Fimbriimonadaceae bacterium]